MFIAVIILCVVLFLVQLFSPIDLMFLGVTDTSPFYTWLTYHWLHTDPIHLFINIVVIRAHTRVLFKYVKTKVMLGVIVPSVLGGTLLCRFSLPTIGMSAIGYSLVAIYCMFCLFNIFQVKKEALYIYLFSVLCSLILPVFSSVANYSLHIVSFAFASLITVLIILYYGRSILRH